MSSAIENSITRQSPRRKKERKIIIISVLIVVSIFIRSYWSRWGRWYSPSPYHALQTDALLDGRFALSHDIRNMDWDLAWSDGGVQQVWGLGVAIWKLPFEIIYRLSGGKGCPDVIPLYVAVGLWAWYAVTTALLLRRFLRSPTCGLLAGYLFLLYPPFWNLALGYRLVYEETCFYSCLLSMCLFFGVVRFAITRRRLDFYIVCGLAALSGLVRPTHAIYGIMTLILCGAIHLTRKTSSSLSADSRQQFVRRQRLEFAAGMGIGIAGFLFLAYSNQVRFGSPFEFGHRLTISGADIVYGTRFGNPMHEAGIVPAGKELFAWLFLASPRGRFGPQHQDPVPLQAQTARWRDVYQQTFDFSWLAWFVIAFITSWKRFFVRHSRLHKARLHVLGSKFMHLFLAAWSWFLASLLALCLFYWYFPTLSTRYVLDFAPGFIAPLLLILLLLGRRYALWGSFFGIMWLSIELVMLVWLPNPGFYSSQWLLTSEEVQYLRSDHPRGMSVFRGEYSISAPPSNTGIAFNGAGWQNDGMADGIVQILIDRPKYLEITLGAENVEQGGLNHAQTKQIYRAKIDNAELPVISALPCFSGTNLATRVQFAIPDKILRQKCDQFLVSLCFARGMTDKELYSTRPLYRIRWR